MKSGFIVFLLPLNDSLLPKSVLHIIRSSPSAYVGMPNEVDSELEAALSYCPKPSIVCGNPVCIV